MKRLAILDDCQGAALEMVDRLPLEGEVEIGILHEHVAGGGLEGKIINEVTPKIAP